MASSNKMQLKLAAVMAEKSKRSINDFNLVRVIGHGQFGKVWLANDKKDDFPIAIKFIEKKEVVGSELELQMLHEMYIHTDLRNPYICAVPTYFHDERYLYLLLEYCSQGSLHDVREARRNKRFDEPTVARYTWQISSALSYLHSKTYLHGDLKPENILVNSVGDLKLTDFGLSFPFESAHKYRGCAGTLEYMAPELLNNEYYHIGIDLWALGVVIYELLAGQSPFYHHRESMIRRRILNINYKSPKFIGEYAKDLISKLLVQDHDKRLKLEEVRTHPFITFYDTESDYSDTDEE